MKVLYVSQESNFEPGASKSLVNLIENLSDTIDPIVLVPEIGSLTQELDTLNINYITHKTFPTSTLVGDKGFVKHAKYLVKRIYNSISVLILTNKVKNMDVDIIHNNKVTADIGAVIALKLDIPFVWHIREFMEEDHGREFYNKRRSLNLLSSSDAVIAISESIKSKYQKNINFNIKVIYNGIPYKEIAHSGTKFMNKIIRVLLVGRISEGKGQLTAIKAIHHLHSGEFKNIHLTIVGDIGSQTYHKEITQYISTNNLSGIITLIPFTKELSLLRSNSDIGLICSNKEAFGRVTIETMMAGLLLIGSDSGATSEIIQHGQTGLLYEPNSYISLANEIRVSALNIERTLQIINNGKRLASSSYLISSTAENVNKLYSDILYNEKIASELENI